MIIVQGLALFAFVPLVLWLFLVQPLGPGWSVALGLAIIAGHRAVAAPWAVRHARQRCLWCGRRGPLAGELPVAAGTRTIVFGACDASHERLARQFFGFVARHRAAIAAGIFAPLAVLLAGTLAAALGFSLLPHEFNALQFRVIVAATVVLVSLAFRWSPPSPNPRSAFPVHNLFLLGVRNTLWVFRAVGAWWLVAAAWRAGAGLPW
jgi:hypothetical protein